MNKRIRSWRLDAKVAGSNPPTAGQLLPLGSSPLTAAPFMKVMYVVISLIIIIKDKRIKFSSAGPVVQVSHTSRLTSLILVQRHPACRWAFSLIDSSMVRIVDSKNKSNST